MILKHLSVVNYKNIAQEDIDFADGINCLCGDNGMGKTNIIDIIYYLSMCKSYFNTADSQNICYDRDFFIIQGQYFQENKKEDVYCGFKRGKSKQFKCNKKEYEKLIDHIGLIPVVMISPADSMLITEGSEERRKYMNGVISQYDKTYLQETVSYGRLLKQRNIYLKNVSFSGKVDADMMDVMDDQLVELGESIYKKRVDFINKLLPVFDSYYKRISGGIEQVGLVYNSQLDDGDFAGQLKQSRGKDLRMTHSTVGIHRDDLHLEISGYSLKRSGSQGQQKTFLIALKLAQMEFLTQASGKKPILLLDDIFDKLDKYRVTRFLQMLAEKKCGQIFLTDTNRERVEELIKDLNFGDAKIFNICNGKVN